MFLVWASKYICLPVLCFTPPSVRSSTPGFASSANTWHQIHSTHWLVSVSHSFPFLKNLRPWRYLFSKYFVYIFIHVWRRMRWNCSIYLLVDILQELCHYEIVPQIGLHQILLRQRGGFDNRDGELQHKDAIFCKYLGTCLTEMYESNSLHNLRISGKPAKLLTGTHFGITTVAQ